MKKEPKRNTKKGGLPATSVLADPLDRFALPAGTKGPRLSQLPDPGQKGGPFCPALAVPIGKPGQKGFPDRDKSLVL